MVRSLEQDDSFYEDRATRSIGTILFKALGLTEEQKEKFRQKRDNVRKIAEEMRGLMSSVEDVRNGIENKNKAVEKTISTLQSTITPRQVAKFILWVNNNPNCVQVLNAIWKSGPKIIPDSHTPASSSSSLNTNNS